MPKPYSLAGDTTGKMQKNKYLSEKFMIIPIIICNFASKENVK